MKKILIVLLMAFIALLPMYSYAEPLSEDAPIQLFESRSALWNIPFGLSKNETVQRLLDEKGIKMIETSVEPSYAPDSTFLASDQDQPVTFLNYPATVRITCSKSATLNGQKYRFAEPVYTYLTIDFEEIKNKENNNDYIEEGIKQLLTVLDAFSAKYGNPTLIYYAKAEKSGDDSEYHKVTSDFLTRDNIMNLLADKWYYYSFVTYYHNISVSAGVFNTNWHTNLAFGLMTSNEIEENLKDRFVEPVDEPEPISLGLD